MLEKLIVTQLFSKLLDGKRGIAVLKAANNTTLSRRCYNLLL
jgi:hypothetical protein